MKQTKPRNRKQFWIGLIFGVASLAAVFFFVDTAELVNVLSSVRYDYLALGGVGILCFLVLRAVRWQFMLGSGVAWKQVFYVQNIGYMLTSLLPLRAGDVARAVLIGQAPAVSVSRGFSTMVVERVLDMLLIVTLLPFTLAEVETLPAWLRVGARASGVASIVAILVLIAAANQRALARRISASTFGRIRFLNGDKWVQRIDDLLAGLSSLTRLKDGLILIGLTILVWVPIVAAYFTVLRAVFLQPTWTVAAFVVCAAAFSVAAPSTPAQAGPFHAGVFAALQVAGQPAAESAGFAVLYHAVNLLLMVLMGAIGFMATGSEWGQVIAMTRQFMGGTDQSQETAE